VETGEPNGPQYSGSAKADHRSGGRRGSKSVGDQQQLLDGDNLPTTAQTNFSAPTNCLHFRQREN